MKILAIETSCDETSASVVTDGKHVDSLVVNSQIDLHRAYGGVVPEVAARSHIEVMIPVVEQALDEAKVNWNDIDAIAVTQGPGLLGSLLIGVLTARTLAWSKKLPLYPTHHILGHIYASWITSGPNYSTPYPTTQPGFPVLALIVSGGHTQLMLGTDHTNWRVIGRTHDDAVGEAFDKAAKVLGLPYPGGPSIYRCAQGGNHSKYPLPTPKVDDEFGYSFSGLKTALLRSVQTACNKDFQYPSFELAKLLTDDQRADFAASFQKKSIDYLVSKTKLAYTKHHPKTVIIGGGVAASLPLRQAISEAIPTTVEYAPQILCTDNAAMIGACAYYQSQSVKPVNPSELEAMPSWPL